MRVARVQAQAKINLMLHILTRDPTTGYHALSTLFHRIDLADEVVVRAGGASRSVDATGPHLPREGLGPAEQNLAYRAANEFTQRKGWPKNFSIELTKHIPVGGGLGGGSADAGAVLRALNALAPQPMNRDQLWSAACALGADVPFLTEEWVTALGTGRGTELTQIPSRMPPAHLAIVVPQFGIATADAYRWLDEDREKLGWEGFPFVSPGLGFELDRWVGASAWERMGRHEGMSNQFEPAVERRHPELREIRERLTAKGAAMARLAGSGSCVFGVFPDTPPSDAVLGLSAQVIRTRLSSRVVQVEVLE